MLPRNYWRGILEICIWSVLFCFLGIWSILVCFSFVVIYHNDMHNEVSLESARTPLVIAQSRNLRPNYAMMSTEEFEELYEESSPTFSPTFSPTTAAFQNLSSRHPTISELLNILMNPASLESRIQASVSILHGAMYNLLRVALRETIDLTTRRKALDLVSNWGLNKSFPESYYLGKFSLRQRKGIFQMISGSTCFCLQHKVLSTAAVCRLNTRPMSISPGHVFRSLMTLRRRAPLACSISH